MAGGGLALDPRELEKVSKFLSFILRHAPQQVGLRLQPGGWVEVDDLLAGVGGNGWRINRQTLLALVEEEGNFRFSFDQTGQLFRANYGHSVPIDLEMEPAEPPPHLYHGTAIRNLSSIRRSGLNPQERQYVHLSPSRGIAISVGERHGQPVVLTILAGELYRQGHVFFHPAEITWLTGKVPPEAIRFDG